MSPRQERRPLGGSVHWIDAQRRAQVIMQETEITRLECHVALHPRTAPAHA